MIKIFNPYEDLWEPTKEYRTNGLIASLFKSSKSLFVSAPSNYSVARIEELYNQLLEKYETENETENDNDKDNNNEPINNSDSSEIKPNIIVIVDESFADLNVLGDLGIENDYIPFIHSLKNSDRVIKGNLHTSIYGGQTPNSEWEFLTNNTMAFMPARTIPFQQYIYTSLQSIVSTLEAQGYTTSAFHSYYKNGYRRPYVYGFLGFDTFLDVDELENINYLRQYADDRSTFQNIINLLENKQEDEHIFNYTLTMQNHSSYDFEGYDAQYTQRDPKFYRTNQYISVAHESDQALKEFLEYIENYDEPTIVLFFGDHQPRIDDELVYNVLNSYDDPESKEVQEKKYIVPYVLWANYDLDIEDESLKKIDDISMNYLSGVLLKVAKLKTPLYIDFLEELRKTIPVITGNGYMTADGTYHDLNETNEYQELLNTYRIIQYNNVFEKKKKVNELFDIHD